MNIRYRCLTGSNGLFTRFHCLPLLTATKISRRALTQKRCRALVILPRTTSATTNARILPLAIMAIDTRNHNRTLLDTLPFADLSLTRKDVESDKGTVKKPLTLLDLPTEIRLMILNEVFAEISELPLPPNQDKSLSVFCWK